MTTPRPGPTAHYFRPAPDTASVPRTVSLRLPDLTVDLDADRATFSADHVDPGTRLLLVDGAAPRSDDRNLLDLGCGYGPIAVALAHRAPRATVWAVDVNPRAVACCAANARRLGLTALRALTIPEELWARPTSVVPDEVTFDGIWSNPPVRVGKDALHALLDDALGRLSPDGAAHLVVHKHLGADSLARWLTSLGWVVTRRCSRAGYRLLDVSHAETTQARP